MPEPQGARIPAPRVHPPHAPKAMSNQQMIPDGALGMGGVETVAAAVRADLAARLPSQNKKQREGLALLVATALDVRSVNLRELAAAVPRGRAVGHALSMDQPAARQRADRC